jgi:hypothetical protein
MGGSEESIDRSTVWKQPTFACTKLQHLSKRERSVYPEVPG